jgi:hypothetical protein
MDAVVDFESRKLKSPTSSDRSGCQKRLLLAELLVGPRKKVSAWLPKTPRLHLKVRAQHGSLTCGPPFVPKVRRAQRIFNQGAGSASNAAVPARFGGTQRSSFAISGDGQTAWCKTIAGCAPRYNEHETLGRFISGALLSRWKF